MVAVVQFKHATNKFSLAHEIGHLFGCEHDDFKAVTDAHNKNFEYGFYIDHPASHELHTIMA